MKTNSQRKFVFKIMMILNELFNYEVPNAKVEFVKVAAL